MDENNSENLNEQNINSETVENPSEKPRNKKMNIISTILILAIFIGLTIYMITVDGLDNIIKLLKSVDYRWVLGGVGVLILWFICDAITLHLPLKTIYKDQKFSNSFKVAMIGQLFNNITPFSSGGQPMQAYELAKDGKRVSDSLSAMTMKFIITQTALAIFTTVIIVIQFDFLKDLMKDYMWIVILSFLVNLLAIIFVLLAGIKKGIIINICKPFIKLGSKLHIVKDKEKTIDKFDESVSNFSEQFKNMKHYPKTIVGIFISAIIQSMLYYSITYFVYRAFGNVGVSYFQIIPAQAILLLIMTFIPTPGSGGGAEGGFLLIFNSIFKQGTINLSILFWRLYTFYLPIIVGSFFLIPTKKKDQ
ncbi:MAG: flippase-like domain-containing protein [Clostridia bacterium]|nr:flippase-like domain-containing protein [Clostridia bacterium]